MEGVYVRPHLFMLHLLFLGYLVGHLGNFWIFDLMFFGFRACLTVWVCALALALLSRSHSRHCSLSRSLFIYIIVWLYYIILCIYLPRNLSYSKLIPRCFGEAARGLEGALGVPWEISAGSNLPADIYFSSCPSYITCFMTLFSFINWLFLGCTGLFLSGERILATCYVLR